jgi:hypothetical protein
MIRAMHPFSPADAGAQLGDGSGFIGTALHWTPSFAGAHL